MTTLNLTTKLELVDFKILNESIGCMAYVSVNGATPSWYTEAIFEKRFKIKITALLNA
jgi:hypothetical protein